MLDKQRKRQRKLIAGQVIGGTIGLLGYGYRGVIPGAKYGYSFVNELDNN